MALLELIKSYLAWKTGFHWELTFVMLVIVIVMSPGLEVMQRVCPRNFSKQHLRIARTGSMNVSRSLPTLGQKTVKMLKKITKKYCFKIILPSKR